MRSLAIGRLALAAAALAASAAQAQTAWSLKLPAEEAVMYRGVINLDTAGSGAGRMMYPAPSAAGFLVAVVTHGLLLEATKNSEKTARQTQADRVLVSYRPVLDDFKASDLLRSAVRKMASPGRLVPATAATAGDGLLVESTPVFAMTQDQQALVLDNTVTITRTGEAKPIYQATVRVVSQPRIDEELHAFWTDEDGRRLRAESTSLLAHSLEMALRDGTAAPADGTPAFRTLRYPEGGTEKLERAQVVSQHCGRTVIRTLRGWVMSVPAFAEAEAVPAAGCTPALAGWK
jgi:hypothetical protein